MAKKGSIEQDDNAYTAATMTSGFGQSPEVEVETMEAPNRVVTSVDQAIRLTDTDIKDARKLIINARRITAKKQGATPYDPAKLKAQAKSSKRNISTRFLQKELARAASRFYMPVLTASTLTAAELPAGWPKGPDKTMFFRNTISRAIRGWRKNDMYWRGIAGEVCDYGYGFAVWTDPYEWRPHLVRMDKGFVPRGTEIMDDNLGRFTLKWDYPPDQLLNLVRKAIDAGSENWKNDAVANAVDHASLPNLPKDMTQLRKWEEMIREQSWDYAYSRSIRMIETRHLWVLEFSGKVSHYILWPAGPSDAKLLYENLDEYDSMMQAVIPVVFGYGDGTIHGSWGVGQLLYDLAAQVEKIRCDSIDNLLNSNKARLQVPNAKDAASAQLVINDTMIIATGAQFAQNVGGISGNPEGYKVLVGEMTQWAQEIIGSYLPPMPDKSSLAATAIAQQAQQQEQEIQKDVLESWLKQVAAIVNEMVRRMLDKDSDDDYGQKVRDTLLGKVGKDMPQPPVSLTEQELEILINQPTIQSVADFTQFAASQRGAFCATVQQSPLFKSSSVARYMAAGVGNDAFVADVCVADGDNSTSTGQARDQLKENTTLKSGVVLPVIPSDAHEIHLTALKPTLDGAIQNGDIQGAKAMLTHGAAHYAAGVSTKTIRPDEINNWKSQIATWQQALDAKQHEMLAAQQGQQYSGALTAQPGQIPGMPAPAVPPGGPELQVLPGGAGAAAQGM